MCLAIPYGKDNTDESKLWYELRTHPLYLLGLGAVIQCIFLAIFWLLLNNHLLNDSSLIISSNKVMAYGLVFGVFSFTFFALSMSIYPKKFNCGDIEYPYFGAFFFLATYNSILFYIASVTSAKLMAVAIFIHFSLLLFAFKPLWSAYFWADKHTKPFARMINIIFFSLILSQIGVLSLQY
ncbi:MAG: hypothetical protein KAI02_01255 [Gammaproteobacteria bacterium]|nr:hypothetical protein [Gammaproteobacteria bacterium]